MIANQAKYFVTFVEGLQVANDYEFTKLSTSIFLV